MISKPKFTVFFSPNAGGIAIQNVLVQFRIFSSVPEIFEAEVRSRPQTGQIFLALKFFFGGKAPEILDRHYKIQPSADHRAKFRADRPTHLGDLALE